MRGSLAGESWPTILGFRPRFAGSAAATATIVAASILYGTAVPEIWRVAFAVIGATAAGLLVGSDVLLQLILATAGVSLAPVTGGEKGLLPELGGVNLEGLRVLTLVSIGAILCLWNSSLRSALLTRKAYLTFLAMAGLSLLWTTSRFDGLRLLFKLWIPLFGYGLAMEVSRAKGPQPVRAAMVAGALISGVVGVLWRAMTGEWSSAEWPGRYQGALGPSTLGLYSSAMALPIYGWARTQRSWKLYLLFAALAVQTVSTGTRIAVLALGGGLLALELTGGARLRSALVAGAGLALWLLVPTLGARTWGADAGQGALESVNSSGRLLIWADVWNGMVGGADPWGHGIGSSTAYLTGRFNPTGFTGGVGMEVHNEYLRMLAELGPIGLGLFLLACAGVVRDLARRCRKAAPGQAEAIIALSSVLAFLVASATDNTLTFYSYSLVPWALAGVALSLPATPRSRPA